MKVLITGFTPFGGKSLNPADEAVKLLDNEITGAEIVKAESPTAVSNTAGTFVCNHLMYGVLYLID